MEKVFFENSKGQRIVGILDEPDADKERIVIIIHGNSTSKDGISSTEISEELAKRNINTLRIDLDGCGESEGKFEDQTISSSVDDTSSAIKFVKDRGYSKIEILGNSAGGLTAMATALKHSEIKKIGLKAPVSDYPSQRLRKHGQEYIDRWREQGYNYKIGRDGRKLKVKYSFYEDSKKHVNKLFGDFFSG